MMASTSILLLVFTVVVGLLCIAVITRKSYTNPSPVLRALSNNMMIYNLWMILWMVFQYFVIHIQNNFSPTTASIIIQSIFLLMAIFAPIWWYSLMMVVESLLLHDFSRLIKRLTIIIPICFVSLLIVGFIWFLVTGNQFILAIIKDAIIFFNNITLLYAMVYLFLKSFKIGNKEIGNAAKVIAFSYIIILIALFLHKILNYFPSLSGHLVLAEVVIELFVNIITLSWVIWAGNIFCLKTELNISAQNIALAHQDLNMFTKREQEIIHLILSGKSNQEIANELFISLKTVKGHIYNIFQKTDVKNRVQLVNMFLKKESGNSD